MQNVLVFCISILAAWKVTDLVFPRRELPTKESQKLIILLFYYCVKLQTENREPTKQDYKTAIARWNDFIGNEASKFDEKKLETIAQAMDIETDN